MGDEKSVKWIMILWRIIWTGKSIYRENMSLMQGIFNKSLFVTVFDKILCRKREFVRFMSMFH